MPPVLATLNRQMTCQIIAERVSRALPLFFSSYLVHGTEEDRIQVWDSLWISPDEGPCLDGDLICIKLLDLLMIIH